MSDREQRLEAARRIVAAQLRGRPARELGRVPMDALVPGAPSPAVDRVRREIREKYLDYDAFEATLVEGYADELTLPDLQAIADFYESPAGGRFLEVQGRLGLRAAAAAGRGFDAHREEIQAAFQEAFREQYAAGEPPEGEG